MRTFYTSDHHFHHEGIIRHQRPEFPTVEAMNEHLIDQWNSVVRPNDKVIHLGDFSLKPAHIPAILQRLNGDVTLFAGNHEPFWTARHNKVKARNALTRYESMGFASLEPAGHTLHTINGHTVILSHLPYYGDSQRDERYSQHRPQDTGLPIVCGHVHRAWEKLYGEGKTHRGQVHVGVDAWNYLPVEQDQLVELLKEARPDTFGGDL